MVKDKELDFDAELEKVAESQKAIQDAIAKKQEELNKAYEPLRAKLLATRSELEAELNDIADKIAVIDRKTGKTSPTKKGKKGRRTKEELAQLESKVQEAVKALAGKKIARGDLLKQFLFFAEENIIGVCKKYGEVDIVNEGTRGQPVYAFPK